MLRRAREREWGVRVNVPVGHELAGTSLPGLLLDAAPLQAGRCAARVWRGDRALPVLKQCPRRLCGETPFCRQHAEPASRPHGVWDPGGGHSDLARECPERLKAAVREATSREADRRVKAERGVKQEPPDRLQPSLLEVLQRPAKRFRSKQTFAEAKAVAGARARAGRPGPAAVVDLTAELAGHDGEAAELSTTYPEHLAWYREAELKHCRVAMLAFVGFIAPDGFRIPIPQLEDPALNLYNAHGKLIGPGLGEGPMWWLLAFCGVVESLRFKDLGLGFEKLTLENAGDLNFGKGFLPQTKEGEVQMRIKELKNGRLAMLAVSGILTQSVVWQTPHFPFVPGS
ncbi:unnamed protein product [Prorocentrum cordatum]|uniref:Uncharacterized protein n=1 Tax=Prorocentrum cordatum TaxID=2364126 RepID=A0ABN9T9A1_9DINO|nr:unnamed protein product [Polarella glacialis]